MEMVKACCSEVNLNLESISNCNFLIFFFLFYLSFWQIIDIKTKKNKINYFNFLLYYQIVRIVYLCVKTENKFFFIAFQGSFIPKRLKNSKNLKKKNHAFGFLVAMATGMPL